MAGDIEQPFTFNFQVESAISDSISFGRFEKESLSWERRSSFSHNRYLEEVEKFSKPGSVNEKKAYFEAHFKKKGGLLGQNSAESHTIENDVPELVNQEAEVEIINMENHDGHFDDSSVSSQDHGDHLVTKFEEMPKHGISAPNPKFENSFSSVVNAEINEQDDTGENKFSTFVSDEPEVEINQDAKSHGMSENMQPKAMEAVPKTELVKKAGNNCSGSQQTLASKMISRRQTKASSRSQASIHQSPRNFSGDVLKSSKSKGEPSHTTCTEAHPSKTAISRANAVRRIPKVEDSKVLKGRTILESRRCSGEKVQTSGVLYSSPSKLESRSYLKTTTRQSRPVNSAMQDTGKSASASNRTGLAERRKQSKPDSEMKKSQKNVDIRSKPIPSSYGAVRPESDGKKAVFSGTKARNTLRKSTVMASSLHSQLGKDIDSSAREAPYTSKNMSYHAGVHVQASSNSLSSSANHQETENKRRKDKTKEKEPNVQQPRILENYKTTSKKGSEGRQKVGAQRSMNLMGRSRDVKGVAGSGMGRLAVGVTS